MRLKIINICFSVIISFGAVSSLKANIRNVTPFVGHNKIFALPKSPTFISYKILHFIGELEQNLSL